MWRAKAPFQKNPVGLRTTAKKPGLPAAKQRKAYFSLNSSYHMSSAKLLLPLCYSHCSKSSFFVQKFNFDFPRKLSIFFGVKNSWKCCGFGLFSCWQLWFHKKNCQKKFGWKTRENVEVLSNLNFWTKIWQFEYCVFCCTQNRKRKLVKVCLRLS